MQKKIEKMFCNFEIIAIELVALNTLFYWERILFIRGQYVEKQSQEFQTLLKSNFSSSFSLRLIKNNNKSTAVEIQAVFWSL